MSGKQKDWIDVLKEAAVSGREEHLPEGLWDRISDSLGQQQKPVARGRRLYIWSASVAAAVLLGVGIFMLGTWREEGGFVTAEDPTVATDDIRPGKDQNEAVDKQVPGSITVDHSPAERVIAPAITSATSSTLPGPGEEPSVTEITDNIPALHHAATGSSTEPAAEGDKERKKEPVTSKGKDINMSPSNGFGGLPDLFTAKRASGRKVMVALAGNGVGTISNTNSPAGSAKSAMASTTLLPDREGMMVLDVVRNSKNIDFDRYNYNHRQPLTFALTFDMSLGHNLYAGAGVSYTRLSSKASLSGGSEIKQLIQYVGIPVSFKWAFLNTTHFMLYTGVEAHPEFCVGAKFGDENPDIRTMQFSAHAVAGAQVNIGRHAGIYVEPKLSHYFLDTSLKTIRNTKGVNFNLQLGLRFSY